MGVDGNVLEPYNKNRIMLEPQQLLCLRGGS